MKQYLLSIMKGQDNSFAAQVIIYLLWPWSLLYRLGVFCQQAYYRFKGAYKASKPVISIGNITVGGSGKTPLVIWLARHLQDKGYKSIILIRGYMPKASHLSDEVDMINEQIPLIPVIAGRNRVANIREAEDIMPVDLYICDDAFQHWPLYRDLNIVVVDAVNPFGNGYLLPAGILREPLGSLKRADIFMLSKADLANDIQALRHRLKQINPKALMVVGRYKSTGVINVFDARPKPDDFLKDKRVAAFCGIGEPVSFESSLKNSGAKLIKFFTFLDHYLYRKTDIQRMVDFCRKEHIDVLITTHKDAVKLRVSKNEFSGIDLVYMPIQLEITEGADEFIQKVTSICLD